MDIITLGDESAYDSGDDAHSGSGSAASVFDGTDLAQHERTVRAPRFDERRRIGERVGDDLHAFVERDAHQISRVREMTDEPTPNG